MTTWKDKILNTEPKVGDVYKINPDSNKNDWDGVEPPDEDRRFELGISDDDMYDECKWVFDDHWYISTKFLKEHFIKVKQ